MKQWTLKLECASAEEMVHLLLAAATCTAALGDNIDALGIYAEMVLAYDARSAQLAASPAATLRRIS